MENLSLEVLNYIELFITNNYTYDKIVECLGNEFNIGENLAIEILDNFLNDVY